MFICVIQLYPLSFINFHAILSIFICFHPIFILLGLFVHLRPIHQQPYSRQVLINGHTFHTNLTWYCSFHTPTVLNVRLSEDKTVTWSPCQKHLPSQTIRKRWSYLLGDIATTSYWAYTLLPIVYLACLLSVVHAELRRVIGGEIATLHWNQPIPA